MNNKFDEYKSLIEINKYSDVYQDLKDYVQDNQVWLENRFLNELNNLDNDGLFYFFMLFINKEKFYGILLQYGKNTQIIEGMEFSTFSDNPFNESILINFLDDVISRNDTEIFALYLSKIGHPISFKSLDSIIANKEFEQILVEKLINMNVYTLEIFGLNTIESLKLLITKKSNLMNILLKKFSLTEDEFKQLDCLTEDSEIKRLLKKQNEVYKIFLLETGLKDIYYYMLSYNDLLFQIKRYMNWLPKNWLTKMFNMASNNVFDDINDKLLSKDPEERIEQIGTMLNTLLSRFNERNKMLDSIKMPYIDMEIFLNNKLNRYQEKILPLLTESLNLIESKDYNSLKKLLDNNESLLEELNLMVKKQNFENSEFGQFYQQAVHNVFKY